MKYINRILTLVTIMILLLSCSKADITSNIKQPYVNQTKIHYDIYNPDEDELSALIHEIQKDLKLNKSNQKGLNDVFRIPISQALFIMEEYTNSEFCRINSDDRFINQETSKSTFSLPYKKIISDYQITSSSLKQSLHYLKNELENYPLPDGYKLILADIEPIKVTTDEIIFEASYLIGKWINTYYEIEDVFNEGWRWGRVYGKGGGLCNTLQGNRFGFDGADAAISYFVLEHYRPRGVSYEVPQCRRATIYMTNITQYGVTPFNSDQYDNFYTDCGPPNQNNPPCSLWNKFLVGYNLHNICVPTSEMYNSYNFLIDHIDTYTSIDRDNVINPYNKKTGEYFNLNLNRFGAGGSLSSWLESFYFEIYMGERRCTKYNAPIDEIIN